MSHPRNRRNNPVARVSQLQLLEGLCDIDMDALRIYHAQIEQRVKEGRSITISISGIRSHGRYSRYLLYSQYNSRLYYPCRATFL
jgi:hypothetical protein